MDNSPITSEISIKPKLYDPSLYAFLALFLGVEIVLFMSWMNAKFLPDAEQHKKIIKKFTLLFFGLLIAYFLVLGWATSVATKGLSSAMTSSYEQFSKVYSAQITGDFSQINNSQLNFAKTVVSNASTIYFILNLVLLIFLIKSTNKSEAKYCAEGFKAKTIQGKNAILPFFLGIAYIAFIYMYSNGVIIEIAKIFLKF